MQLWTGLFTKCKKTSTANSTIGWRRLLRFSNLKMQVVKTFFYFFGGGVEGGRGVSRLKLLQWSFVSELLWRCYFLDCVGSEANNFFNKINCIGDGHKKCQVTFSFPWTLAQNPLNFYDPEQFYRVCQTTFKSKQSQRSTLNRHSFRLHLHKLCNACLTNFWPFPLRTLICHIYLHFMMKHNTY